MFPFSNCPFFSVMLGTGLYFQVLSSWTILVVNRWQFLCGAKQKVIELHKLSKAIQTITKTSSGSIACCSLKQYIELSIHFVVQVKNLHSRSNHWNESAELQDRSCNLGVSLATCQWPSAAPSFDDNDFHESLDNDMCPSWFSSLLSWTTTICKV